jgi:hypothetical protein
VERERSGRLANRPPKTGVLLCSSAALLAIGALFVWLISHQPAVFFSQNKPANSTLLSQQISTSHQPNEQGVALRACSKIDSIK